MLSERYRPKDWSEFVGQPVIDEIQAACGDSWLFDGCGERWLLESDGIAGCGIRPPAQAAWRQEKGLTRYEPHQTNSTGVAAPTMARPIE